MKNLFRSIFIDKYETTAIYIKKFCFLGADILWYAVYRYVDALFYRKKNIFLVDKQMRFG